MFVGLRDLRAEQDQGGCDCDIQQLTDRAGNSMRHMVRSASVKLFCSGDGFLFYSGLALGF